MAEPTTCTLPTFVPSACGISNKLVFADITTRAARKALKGPSIYAGQAQSSRIRSLKRCVVQVNTSEQAFNQVSRSIIQVQDTVQQQVIEYQNQLTQETMIFSEQKTIPPAEPLRLDTFDPSGNLYTLVVDVSNTAIVTSFANGLLTVGVQGPALPFADTLASANFFWRNNILVFVGIFNTATNNHVNIYTYNAALVPTLVLRIDNPNTRTYTGQATYTSTNYIYVALCQLSSNGYDTSPVYYIAPNWSYITTNQQASYSSIQQCVGDASGGALVAAYSTLGLYVTYFSNGVLFWRYQLTSAAAPCATARLNGSFFILYYNGTDVISQSITYPQFGPQNTLAITWPFGIPYTVVSVSLAVEAASQRIFYKMYLNNPSVANFTDFIQVGEIDVNGNILTFFNVQVDASTLTPTKTINTIQTSQKKVAVTSGFDITTYDIAFDESVPVIVTIDVSRNFCQTYIVYPGCDCPKVPKDSINPPADSFTRTLNLAICRPITYVNPASPSVCSPVYTSPTNYLTEAQGAEPPQGPAVTTVSRKYQNINGIDEICRPIPKRYASSRTALIRTSIEAASATLYAATVLPVVSYPFPCPVYGNQAGIPKASLCRPTIDGRPTGPV